MSSDQLVHSLLGVGKVFFFLIRWKILFNVIKITYAKLNKKTS